MSWRNGVDGRLPVTETLIRPAHLWVPERVGSYGDEAVDLTRLAGRDLDPEQVIAVDATLSYGPDARWVALETATIEARQNGKTGGELLPCVLFDLFLNPPADRIVWTAHLFKTARDAFNDFVGLIDGCGYLSRRVKRISYSHGEEIIELHSGATLEFLARSKGGGRGLGGKRLVMDEALFLSAESMGALIPTLAARSVTGDPQINYGSSAGLDTSDHLIALRRRALRGNDPSLVWVEYGSGLTWDNMPCELGVNCTHVVDTPGCALDDESLWPAANHAIGKRISYQYVRSERRALPPAEFGRERLGIWPLDDGQGRWKVIPAVMWAAAEDDQAKHRGALTFAVDVTPNRATAAVGAAAPRDGGGRLIDVFEHRPGGGVRWVLGVLKELDAKYRPLVMMINDKALADEAEEAGLKVHRASPADEAAGAAALYDGIAGPDQAGRDVKHKGRKELTDAAAGAATREISGTQSWKWDRSDPTVDISPLVATSLALWALGTPRLHRVRRVASVAVAGGRREGLRTRPEPPAVEDARMREQIERDLARSG